MKNIVLALVAILFLGALGYFLWSKDVDQKETHLQVIVGNFVDARVYELSGDKLVDISFSGGDSVTSRSRRLNIGSAMTVFMQSGEVGNTLILENVEGNKFLDAPFGIKDKPSLSFNGNLIAYSYLTLEPGVLYSENVADWRVHVLNIETGEVVDIGVGYAPHFIFNVPDVVFFSSPEGLVAVNLELEDRTVFEARKVEFVTRAAHASPQGSHIAAFNELTQRYSIFEVLDAEALQLNPIGEIPERFDLIALSNSAFYGVHRDEDTGVVTLLKYSLDSIIPPVTYMAGEPLHIFKDGETPYQLIP